MTNLEIIRNALEDYDYVGVRGLNGINSQKKYRKNQILQRSFDLWGDKQPGEEFLRGTCAIEVNSDMNDDEILDAINQAARYAFGNSVNVIVIAGDMASHGDDRNEIIISNQDGWDIRGARYISKLTF